MSLPTVASWPPYRFLRRQVRWSGISHLLKNFPHFVVIHTVKGFNVIKEADVFLESFCFFDDSMEVGNLISGSSAFSQSSLKIWKFLIHILLKSSLESVVPPTHLFFLNFVAFIFDVKSKKNHHPYWFQVTLTPIFKISYLKFKFKTFYVNFCVWYKTVI